MGRRLRLLGLQAWWLFQKTFPDQILSPRQPDATGRGLVGQRLTRLAGAIRLRASATAITLVLMSGSWLVINHPRPKALGLARLLVAADLLQSFTPDPSQPVPALWQQRLGPRARNVWNHSNRSWWQLWSRHDGGGAYLVLHADDLPPGQRPESTVSVDDLLVIGADRLAAEQLAASLGSIRKDALQGLEKRCLERLQQEQAVYWSSHGLSGVLGPLSPLLMQWQQGCLSLDLDADRLGWEGEAGAVAGLQGPSPPRLPSRAAHTTPINRLTPDTLLTIRGERLEQLLGGLLRRSLVRDSLTNQYGLDAGRLARLGGSRFHLQLRVLARGPFRLGLILAIPIGTERQAWMAALEEVSAGIRRQGLQSVQTETTAGQGRGAQGLPQPRTWMRRDGTVVGGWRWLSTGPSEPSNRQRQDSLVLFLGPPPPSQSLQAAASSGLDRERLGEQVQLEILMRPSGLSTEQLLPATLPPLINAADILVLVAGEDGPGRITPLSGELRLPR